MPSWYLKAAIQGCLSVLPQSYRWNYVLQRHVSKNLRLRETYFEKKLSVCTQHMEHYHRYNSEPPARIVELGTGWLPIIPLGLALLSEEAEIISIDLTPLLRDQLVLETLAFFVQYAKEGRLAEHLPNVNNSRIELLQEVLDTIEKTGAEYALSQLGITYIVGDARKVELDHVDLVVSNNTLEHIPGDVIQGIFQNFRRMLGDNGLMSHSIDLSDHYSHFDDQLTPYNFLKFSSARWKLYNNKLQYQNRLRASQYRAIHERAGFEVLSEDHHSNSIEELKHIMVAPEFRSYSPEDLAVTASWIVSRPSNR